MQKSSLGLGQRTDVAAGASSSNTGNIILVSPCSHSTYQRRDHGENLLPQS